MLTFARLYEPGAARLAEFRETFYPPPPSTG